MSTYDSASAEIIRQRTTASRDTARRVRDVVGSLLLLSLTSPLMLLVACLIKLESRGPVLYRQQRLGLHGQPFTVLKFRSMCHDAEADGPCWAAIRDPRITRIGTIIRAFRIDELPQLFNILYGEMSLVGPRPERPHFAKQLAQVVPHYDERTSVLPGLTGWAQVKFRYGASIDDARTKLEYDLYYMRNRSHRLDLQILIATVMVVLFGTGAR